ncbi:hypothetical protein [Campylobacter troglodytis]|nr:hypothetical protein [Campylobacter troglodytis]
MRYFLLRLTASPFARSLDLEAKRRWVLSNFRAKFVQNFQRSSHFDSQRV